MRQAWHAERLSVARQAEVAAYGSPLTISMQVGMLPCSRCGETDHPSSSKYCPRRESVRSTLGPKTKVKRKQAKRVAFRAQHGPASPKPPSSRPRPTNSPRRAARLMQTAARTTTGTKAGNKTESHTFLTQAESELKNDPSRRSLGGNTEKFGGNGVGADQTPWREGDPVPEGMVMVKHHRHVRLARGLSAAAHAVDVPSISAIVSRRALRKRQGNGQPNPRHPLSGVRGQHKRNAGPKVTLRGTKLREGSTCVRYSRLT